MKNDMPIGMGAGTTRRGRRQALATLAAGAASLAVQRGAWAAAKNAWPEHPINYVVPFPPGGLTDVAARLIAKALSSANNWNIVVENKAGGSANIGAAYVARSAPDGYTWLAMTMTHAVNVTLFEGKAGYDLMKDLTPLANIASCGMMIVVNPKSDIRTLADLTRKAREKSLNAGSSGNGTPPHLTLALYEKLTGTKIVHVPYKGGAPSLTDLLGGQIDVIFSNYPESLSYVKNGSLRALAVCSKQRSADLPDVPTVVEAGLPDLIVENFTGVMGPAHMDPKLVELIGDAIVKQVDQPDMREALARLGFVAQPRGPAQFKTYLADQIKLWRGVIHDAHITVS
jgi:tripartite-type tricarboxylate transporter receptor subunit TctC